MLEIVIPGLLLSVLVISLYDKKFSESWIWLIIALSFPYAIRSTFLLVLFIISTIFGGVTDWLGVKRKEWQYSRKQYPFWIWFCWGYAVVMIYLTAQGLSVNPLLALSFAVGAAIMVNQFYRAHDFGPRTILMVLTIIPLLYYTDKVVFGSVAILMCLFIEVLGCKFTKAWIYKKPDFLNMGTAYAALCWFALRLVETFLRINPISLIELAAIGCFLLLNYRA